MIDIFPFAMSLNDDRYLLIVTHDNGNLYITSTYYLIQVADIEKAIQHFEQASDYFKGEENNSSSNKCLLKVAMYAAQMENYEKGIQIYEQVGSFLLGIQE